MLWLIAIIGTNNRNNSMETEQYKSWETVTIKTEITWVVSTQSDALIWEVSSEVPDVLVRYISEYMSAFCYFITVSGHRKDKDFRVVTAL